VARGLTAVARVLRLTTLTAIAFGSATQARLAIRISDHARAGPAVRRCLTSPLVRRPTYNDSEAHAAANPANPRHLVAAWQTSNRGGAVIQAAASFDGGRSWTGPAALPVNQCAGGPSGARRASDPWATIGPDGRAYVAGIGWRPSPGDGPDEFSALVVMVSPNGGRTWDLHRVAALAPRDSAVRHDNVAIIADPTRPGAVYLTTTRYADRVGADGRTRTVGPIGFTRSIDGGRSWEPLRTISPDVESGRVSAPVPLVDPRTGRLFIVYFRSGEGKRIIGVLTSADQGESFGPEIEIAPYVMGRATPPDPIEKRPFVLAGDIVRAAVDSGAIVVAYADARLDPGERLGVSLVFSTDGGAAWSTPVAVLASAGETTWLPDVAIGAREVGLAYLRADLTPRSKETAKIEYRLSRFRLRPSGLELIEDDQIDRAALAWPGDYQALVRIETGFRLVYVRSTLSPDEPLPIKSSDSRRWNPTDVYVR